MPDIATVRSEIKAWERTFKADNGRNPSLDDIKQLPHIAEKYKLYKKLSKQATAKPSALPSQTPSTPPRSHPRASTSNTSLFVQPRHVESTAPLSSFNPFSPQKSKKKPNFTSTHKALHNPFATPTKSSGLRNRALPLPDERELSPDPFPIIQPNFGIKSPRKASPAPDTAVTRARKRLRGEPVSPSPAKPKRRRVAPVQSLLPFRPIGKDHVHGNDNPNDDRFGDVGDDAEPGDGSFVDETPAKLSGANKSYKALFDEAIPLNFFPSQVNGQGKAKSSSPFDFAEDADEFLLGSQRRKTTTPPILSSKTREVKRPPGAQKDRPKAKSKRRHSGSDSEMDTPVDDLNAAAGPSEPTMDTSTLTDLLPPSPPPRDPYANKSHRRNGTNNPRASTSTLAKPKAAQSRKKAKVSQAEAEDESDSDDWERGVQIVGRRPPHVGDNTGEDANGDMDAFDLDDPLFIAPKRDVPDPVPLSTTELATSQKDHAPQTSDELGSTPLPKKLASLNISPPRPFITTEAEEAHLVDDVLYHRPRKGRLYDSRRGGEIWGVGEGEEEELDVDADELVLAGGLHPVAAKKGRKVDVEDDDDWEGEPVPWEVGEL
ncbi:hypothetical protein HGRIS_008144 [Hohenbuehelia grisea]|uniref:DNA replication regulator SLD2 n=1 Tax=Hohenbuehelia grisea TaxID=104357 RepID=A0ABR3J731_9AGAR